MSSALTIGLCVFGLFFLIVVFIASLSAPKEISLLNRLPSTEAETMKMQLNSHVSNSRYGKLHQKYFSKRFMNGGLEKYAKLVGVDIAKTEQNIYGARLEERITVEEVVSMKLIGVAGALVFIGAGAILDFNMLFIAIGFLFYYIGSFYPSKLVDGTMKKRQKSILMNLPGFIELVYSTLEAGSTIQDALTTIAERTTGPLSEEFLSVTARTKVSGRWKQEMEEMADRCGVDQLSDLVSDILISHEKGTSVVEVLKEDAEQLRAIKNAKLTEQAKKLSVTLLIPMALFCFLPMFGLMLMPMLVQFIENF